MGDGWVKLHRKVKESWVWAEDSRFRTWMWILLSVNHKEHWVSIQGSDPIKVLPGQRLTSTLKMSEELNLNRKTITRHLQEFRKREMLGQLKTRRYTLLTVLNWAEYQVEGTTEGTTEGQPDGQLKDNRGDINKKEEKEKNDEELGIKDVREGIKIWNDHAKDLNLAKVQKMTKSRVRHWVARAKEEEGFSIHSVLAEVRQSPWLRGEIPPSQGRQQFQLTLDWVLNEQNLTKILEGQYRDKKPTEKEQTLEMWVNSNEYLQQLSPLLSETSLDRFLEGFREKMGEDMDKRHASYQMAVTHFNGNGGF